MGIWGYHENICMLSLVWPVWPSVKVLWKNSFYSKQTGKTVSCDFWQWTFFPLPHPPVHGLFIIFLLKQVCLACSPRYISISWELSAKYLNVVFLFHSRMTALTLVLLLSWETCKVDDLFVYIFNLTFTHGEFEIVPRI